MGHDADHVRQRERADAREASLEGLAADERHREVRAAFGLPGVGDRHQMLVPDLARRARLVDESPPERLVGRELGAEHLERDLVALGFAYGTEDDAHPAFPEPLLEAVGAEPRAGSRSATRVRIAGSSNPVTRTGARRRGGSPRPLR